MNLKTTFALVVLILVVATLFWTRAAIPPGWSPFATTATTGEGAPDALRTIPAENLTMIEIKKGDRATILTHNTADDGWVMPGNWPTRSAEVKQLVDLLTHLHSRFAPIPIAEGQDLAPFGLEKPIIRVVLTLGPIDRKSPAPHGLETQTIAFGQAPLGEGANRFDRPTFARVEGKNAVIRLGPAVLSILDHPADYYQQRRLFPSEREVRTGSSEKTERLTGKAISIEQARKSFTLTQAKDGWEMSSPLRDRLDPTKRDALLEAVPDLWAERFVKTEPTSPIPGWCWTLGGTGTNPASLASAVFWGQNQTAGVYGLLEPTQTLRVTRPDGAVVTLEIGSPVPKEKNRAYARLKDFDRVFEISTDKLPSIFVTADALRDEQLVRFKADDVREIEITAKGQKVVLKNEAPTDRPEGEIPPPPKWKMVSPTSAQADAGMVRDLLEKLSGITVKDRDALSKVKSKDEALKELGLEKPSAVVKLTIEEKPKPGDETKIKRIVQLAIGKWDKAAKNLFVRVDGWPRVDEIEDGVAVTILDKRAIDYRGKRLFDFADADVAEVKIDHHSPFAVGKEMPAWATGLGIVGRLALARLTFEHSEVYTLQRDASGWRLTEPVKTPAESARGDELADRLASLSVLQYVSDSPSPMALEREYGLTSAPLLRIAVKFKDAKKEPTKFVVGKKRPDAPGWFAQVEGRSEVFALSDDVVDLFTRGSLAYRPTELWKLASTEDASSFQVHKAGQSAYELHRQGGGWEVAGPFTVSAPTPVVEKLATVLTAPHCLKYVAHTTTTPAAFGLDKPAVTVKVTVKDGKSHTLRVGKTASDGSGSYAQLEEGGAVFVIGEELVKTVDQSALDFLDRKLWTIDAISIVRFRRQQGEELLDLQRKDDSWQIVKPTERPADERKVAELLQKVIEPQSARVVDYPAGNLNTYGLDKPEATVTVNGAAEQVLDLGQLVKGEAGTRFAMVRGSKKVVVLSAELVKALLAGPLSYADHALARIPDADRLELEHGKRRVTFRKLDGTWKMTAPMAGPADHDAIESFLDRLYRLRADELVSEKPSADDLKRFGLEKPELKWKVFNGDKEELTLSVGALDKPTFRRFARVAGKDVVALLDPKLSAALTSEYRPQLVWKESIDPSQIEAIRFGHRTNPFELKKSEEGVWRIVGKPGVIDPTRINETLAVLRDLKVDRYVNDRGEELELYGLKPPELTLEVTTPAGKRVLHLGGLEGGSDKRYATVPGAEQSGVFTLSATNSTRLFRQLADLTQPR
jgi:Domain of unknown function (DUF4340)